MPTSLSLSSLIRAKIAAQVAVILPIAGIQRAPKDSAEVGESFAIWCLADAAIIEELPLSGAFPTGRLHHQLYLRGKPTAFAYSRALGPKPDDWQVTGAFDSPGAARLDRAITVADRASKAKGEARVLAIPAYLLEALWLPDAKMLVPWSFPNAYQGRLDIRAYTYEAFFSAVRKLRHAEGVRF